MMSNPLLLDRTSPARIFRLIASPYSFYFETMAGFGLLAILTNVINDTNRTFGSFRDWLAISTAGYAAAFAVLIVGRFIFLNSRRLSLFAVLAVFALTGLARGVTIYFFGLSIGAVTTDQFTYRVFGSMVYSLFLLAQVTVLVSNTVRTGAKADELEQQMLNLQDALINLREKLAVQKAELAGRVKALVYPMVEELIAKVSASRVSGSVAEAVASLKSAVDQEIRPLSLAISDSQDSGLLALTGKPKAKFRLFARLAEPVSVGRLFTPLWMTLFMLVLTASAAFHSFGLTSAPKQLAILAVLTFCLLAIARVSMAKLFLKQDRAFFVHILSYAVIGFIVDLAIMISPFTQGKYVAGKVTTFVVVIGTAFFIVQILQLQRESATRSLEVINDRLEKLTSGARRELWLYRRKVATVLHGPIQARLYASAIRLSQAKRINTALVGRVSGELRAALVELDFEKQQSPSLREVLRQIVDVWSGTCEIYLKVDKSVFLLAKRDSDFNEAFIEVAREAVSNGVKHSKASEIEVSAELVNDIVELRVSNNGSNFEVGAAATKPGFGTALFDELTLSWSLGKGEDQRNQFNAKLVVN